MSEHEPDFHHTVPPGDTLERRVCTRCGFVHYDNPKVVVGSVVRAGDKVLLCRRAIHPRRGFWTMPAGYLELNEDPETGARREAMEEANAELDISGILAVYSVPRLSQVQVIFRATLVGDYSPGEESLEVSLFDWDDIPWDEIAFPSVHWALNHDRATELGEAAPPFVNPAGENGDLLPGGKPLK
jgi:ADP-ribose pyrophosphatase YjhB (NUDIX family)